VALGEASSMTAGLARSDTSRVEYGTVETASAIRARIA
jgi:hypothetical protein